MKIFNCNFPLLFIVSVLSSSTLTSCSLLDRIKSAISEVSETVDSVEDAVEDKVKDFVDNLQSITNGSDLNCLGFPDTLFSTVLESILDSTTKAEYVRFYFANRNRTDYTTVVVANFSLDTTNFEATKDTYIITHGFLGSGQSSWLTEMKEAILNYV